MFWHLVEPLAEPPATSKDVQALERLYGGQGECRTSTQSLVHRIHSSFVQWGEALGVCIVALGDEEPVLALISPVLQVFSSSSLFGLHPSSPHNSLHAWFVLLRCLGRGV